MKTRLWGLGLGAVLGILAASFQRTGLQQNRQELPILGAVADFSLIDQDGRAVTRDTLLGKIWVADFIFTQCEGQCPLMSEKMAQLQSFLPMRGPARLVSISVDPEHDTPDVLAAYAKRFKAQSAVWLFLTGRSDKIVALARQSFKLFVEPVGGSPAEPIQHSDRFVLVDTQGRIRGYYDAFDESAFRRLTKDLGALGGWTVFTYLPSVNALLNLGSALFLAAGYGFIRVKRIGSHRVCMLTAFLLSTLFLASYVTYHARFGANHFRGQGWVRPVYFSILFSHMVLAVVILPLILRTLYLALRRRFEAHRAWARWTLPLWFYVSVTGVIIYEMVY